MTEIQGGRWDNALRKLFPVKGTTVAAQLAPEIIPTMEVQSWDPDLAWLRGERLIMGYAVAGPVVGQHSQVNLRNDATDRLVILERIYFYLGAGAPSTIGVGPGNNAVGVAQSVYGRDLRAGIVITAGSVAGVIRISTLGAPVGLGIYLPLSAAYVLATVEGPFVLPPEGAMFVCDQQAQSTLFVSFMWRERPFEPGEV